VPYHWTYSIHTNIVQSLPKAVLVVTSAAVVAVDAVEAVVVSPVLRVTVTAGPASRKTHHTFPRHLI
jgi:hypothetical protein